jgi:hypothetical protein
VRRAGLRLSGAPVVPQAPGRGPLAPSGPVRCGTCGEIPRSDDLEPIERCTRHREYLRVTRRGDRPWPPPTPQGTCWLCSNQRIVPEHAVDEGLLAELHGIAVRGRAAGQVDLCGRCAAFVEKAREALARRAESGK